MKYFQLFVDENYIPPSLVAWYGKLDRKALEGKRAYELPRHSLFLVEAHQQMVFTDVITFPCFLVSEKVKEILQIYDPTMSYARMVLYEENRQISKTYYYPFLEELEEDIQDDTSMKQFAAEPKENRIELIFKMRAKNRTKVILRLDLLESILRRNPIGIGVREICHTQTK